MKKKKAHLIRLTAAVLLITTCLGTKVWVPNRVVNATTASDEKKTVKLKTTKSNLLEEGYELIAQSDRMLLAIDRSTGSIRWQSKATGAYKDTKLFHSESGTETLKNIRSSDMNFNYIQNEKKTGKITTASMDNYSLSVKLDGVTYEGIENGVKINYQVGDESITFNNFPKFITKERMEELVLQYCSKKEKKTIDAKYRLAKGKYIRESDENKPLGRLAANQLYKIFYETGKYTSEELEADNSANGVETVAARQKIYASIELFLDGDNLVVRVPVSQIKAEEKFPIQSVDVLPYFLSSDEEKDGYLLVPDGSGALIYFNNGKTQEYRYSSRYFGGDYLMNADTFKEPQLPMNLPIYGIKTKDNAVLGIIEKGAEVATLSAYVGGNVDDFNRVSLNFAVRDLDTTKSANSTSVSITKYPQKSYQGDIVIRYCFLEEEEATYSGMANEYKEYLQSNGSLKKNEVEQDAPLYIEMLGAIDKTKYFLGIPYKSKVALTDFNQAKKILSSLNERGISNMKVQYTGTSNGGMDQTSIEKVKVERVLGGKKGLKNLNEYAKDIHADIFPKFQLQTATTAKGLKKVQQSFFLNGLAAEIYEFDTVLCTPIKDNKYPTILINPAFMSTYLERFQSSFSKLGIKHLASSDLGTFLSSNYKRNSNTTQTEAKEMIQGSLEKLDNEYTLMLSNPNSYAYANVGYVTDLPTDHSRNRLFDARIPFVQMVLDGSINYSSSYLNEDHLDITKELLEAIETKSSLKFRFTYEGADILERTEYEDLFLTEYAIWEDKVATYYEEYNEFYQKVKDACIIAHSVDRENSNLRTVTYSNGVKVYLNYGSSEAIIDGVPVASSSYVIK